MDFCSFIRTTWHSTGTTFFPKYGFSWKWRVDRWENIPIDHRSQLQTAKQYLKRCTNYSSIWVIIARFDHILFIRFSFWSNLVIPYFMTFLWSHCLSVYLIKYQYCKKNESLCGEVLTPISRLPFQEKNMLVIVDETEYIRCQIERHHRRHARVLMLYYSIQYFTLAVFLFSWEPWTYKSLTANSTGNVP